MALCLFSETMRRVKRAARILLQGERASEFCEHVPEVPAARADPDGSFNRLNIVTPTLPSRKAFGGVMPLIDLPLQAFGAGLAPAGWRARILCFDPKPEDAENVALKALKRLQIDPGLVDIECGCSEARPLPFSGRDVFLGSMWSHFPRIRPLLEFQRNLNGGPVPRIGRSSSMVGRRRRAIAFYLARAALDEWSQTFPNARQWKVISVGESLPDFTLRSGARVEVKGKLTLADYSGQLRRSAVGLSLMTSPHPSCPPLEMAHFGALTITNSFTCKNLTSWHQNILSLDRATPQEIAAALARACQACRAGP